MRSLSMESPKGPRSISWRPTAPHTLYWVEALDGGDPMAEVPHRDRLMRLEAPFKGDAEEVFKAKHRIQPWMNVWAEEGGMLMLTENERMRRWRYVWLLDVDQGTSRLWFDMDESDRYNNPGNPVREAIAQWALGHASEKGWGIFPGKRGHRTGRQTLSGPPEP